MGTPLISDALTEPKDVCDMELRNSLRYQIASTLYRLQIIKHNTRATKSEIWNREGNQKILVVSCIGWNYKILGEAFTFNIRPWPHGKMVFFMFSP